MSSQCVIILCLVALLVHCATLGEASDIVCKESTPCSCKTDDFSINITDVANDYLGVIIPDPLNKFIYLASLCSPRSCNLYDEDYDRTAAGCQYGKDDQGLRKLGEVDKYEWRVFNETFFTITYRNDPGYVRLMTVSFTVDKFVSKSTLKFERETEANGMLIYNFSGQIKHREHQLEVQEEMN